MSHVIRHIRTADSTVKYPTQQVSFISCLYILQTENLLRTM